MWEVSRSRSPQRRTRTDAKEVMTLICAVDAGKPAENNGRELDKLTLRTMRARRWEYDQSCPGKAELAPKRPGEDPQRVGWLAQAARIGSLTSPTMRRLLQ
ncbi:hypothetical protein KC342_g31 [Hortaea werneckii]|nr:hypothetical protein KC342_g31 [Hortaea werneckii]